MARAVRHEAEGDRAQGEEKVPQLQLTNQNSGLSYQREPARTGRNLFEEHFPIPACSTLPDTNTAKIDLRIVDIQNFKLQKLDKFKFGTRFLTLISNSLVYSK